MFQLSQKRTAQGTSLQGVEVLQPINPGPAQNNPQLLSTDGLSCQVSLSPPPLFGKAWFSCSQAGNPAVTEGQPVRC